MSRERKVNLEEKILRRIKEDNITLRSRYIFIAKKLGLGGGFVLSLILAVLFFNIAFFSLRSSGNLEFLSFGRVGLLAFLESFPYEWVIIAVLFFVGAGVLLSRYDIAYKKPFKILVTILVVLVLAGATTLTISGVNERLEEKAIEGRNPVLGFFYGRRKGVWRHGLVGEIIHIQGETLTIRTPENKQITVEIVEEAFSPSRADFEIGEWIRAVGQRKGDSFQAFAVSRWRRHRGSRERGFRRQK